MSTDILAQLADLARPLATRLGASPTFVEDLRRQNDWTFVVAMSALIEGALAHAIGTRLPESLRGPISRLTMGTLQDGKVGFALALELVTKETAIFLCRFAEVRNAFAHTADHLNQTLDSYSSGHGANKMRELKNAWLKLLGEEARDSLKQLFDKHPRIALELRFVIFLSEMYRVSLPKYGLMAALAAHNPFLLPDLNDFGAGDRK